ncbi:MAG: NAD-dependent DNA ligase LigA [Candidatus Aminicenantaceae bacterium]
MDFKKNPKTDFKDIKNMTKKEAKEEVEALREGIEYHNYYYYVKNNPQISDELYDRLFRRLQDLENAFPELQSDISPTQRVGAEPLDKLKKINHTTSMLSLNAALNEKEAREFNNFIRRNVDKTDIQYVVEPKFDGFSVEVVYKDGIFQYGATRGDGEVGEDISENLKTIRSLPMRIRKQNGNNLLSFLAVRAEVFMPKKEFQKLNKKRIEQGDVPFSNPRNASAGIMRQLDSKKVADKPLDIFFYEILSIEGAEFSSHWKELKQLSAWGLKTDVHNTLCSSFDEVVQYYNNLLPKRDELEYEIDGIVIKLDDLRLRSELGTRQRSPRWAIAWKFPAKKEVTIMEDIVVQVGRTGMLTPVALLQPVDVGGVTVSRATLHNEDEVLRKDIRPGDKVRIARAGDVIPEVVERVEVKDKKRGKKFSMPKKCPVCNSEILKEGAYYFCSAGLSCQAQLIGHIIHYSSREALNIEGLGEKIVKQLVKRGMVHDVADLYHLSKEDLLKLEGFAQKSAQNLYDAIQATKNIRLDRFLYALGIRHVGQHVARVLSREYQRLDKIRDAKKEELEQINEIGPEIAQSVVHFFKQEENKKVLEKLQKAGIHVEDMAVSKKETFLEGKTFVFTGELENYSRDEAESIVEELGGRATSSISGSTDYVVVGNHPGSKLQKAKENNIQILDEKDFIKLIKE